MNRCETCFERTVREKYRKPDISTRTDLRWWMASGLHTDETIREEICAMHDAGFGGVELCQLADSNINETLYGYGSDQWENDVKLILRTVLGTGMSVSLTSGAGWSCANVPGLDPDSQQANQCVVLISEDLGAGQTRKGPLPTGERLRPAASFIGAAAFRKESERIYRPDGYVLLTPFVKERYLEWTAPEDSDWTLMFYYAQGTAQAASPSSGKSYCINYFDRRGVEALKEYLERNVLNDEGINQIITDGDVQIFMDSLEYTSGAGITAWTENFASEFLRRKGYDIIPFLFLAADAPDTSIWNWENNADLRGKYLLSDLSMNKRILDDIFDVQTKLYMEEFLSPFCDWLHTRSMTLRAQISYGKNLEISEPIAAVDRPEAENRNQKNQVDMYRLWSGGAHLQNKVLSAETGGLDNSNYSYTLQRHIQEAYLLYSAGFSRIVWHIWAARFGPQPVWPGYEGGNHMDIFYKFGTREPSYSDYPLLNDHLGRVQTLLREGSPGTDIGMPYIKYGQHMVYGNEKDWLHTHQTMFFPSTVLQDRGYTYDYFNPALLDGASFDEISMTLEPAGYRALILWQKDMSVSGSEKILELADKGLPVIIVSGAAVSSPYMGDDAAKLSCTVAKLKNLPNVKTVPNADHVIDVLKEMNIMPYAGFETPNRQLLTQVRRDGSDRFVFVYNYCDGSLHEGGTEPHGESISSEMAADGIFIPYRIDPWTGETKRVRARYNEGKTYIKVELCPGDIKLYALEATDIKRALECQNTVVSDCIRPLCTSEITGWDLTVEAWTPSDEIETRTETLLGLRTNEYAVRTSKQKIKVSLDRLETWDRIPSVGREISGKGYYQASFIWDPDDCGGEKADGAILDLGKITESVRIRINGTETDPVNLNNPKIDISRLLRNGENTFEAEYSSNLNNLQISRGKVREGILVNRFPGYLTKYESYGLKQAILIPYQNE